MSRTRRGTILARAAGAGLLLWLAACHPPSQSGDAANAAADPPGPVKTESPLGSYLAALHAQQAHDYGNAAMLMERALADDPNNLDLVRRAFVFRVTAGHVAEAMPLAQRLVEIDGNTGLPAMVLLVEAIKDGNFDAAAKRAASMERAGPQRFAVPLVAAWIAAAQKRPDDARRSLAAMGDLQGLEPLRQIHLGMIDDFVDDIDGAQAAYAKVLASQTQPTYRIVETAGNFYERHGRSEDAKRLYQQFGAEGGDVQIAAEGLARIAAGKIPDRVTTTPAQGAADALFDFATVLNQRDTVDASLIYARLALALDPKLALAQLLAGEIREGQNRERDALELYRAIDPASPLSWTAQLRAALALDALGQTDEAVSELKAMAAARPGEEDCLVELGDVLRSHERYGEAAAAYNDAITRLPKTDNDAWRLYYDRGVALERSGDWPHAEADLKHALELSPEQALVLNYLGYSWIDKGQNLSQALQMIEKAVELRPNDGYIVDSLGWAYYRLGNLPKATQYLERAIELLPEDPTINDHLGDVYWQSGRVAEARFQWHRALQVGAEPGDAKTIETKLDSGLAKQPPSPQAVNGG